jgi:hypothetical protein
MLEKVPLLNQDPNDNREKRIALTIDLLKLWRDFTGEQYDSSEHPCGDYRTTRLSEIDKRIDAAIAGADGNRNREGEETGSA